MTNIVETSRPANTPNPIGPYNQIAKVGQFISKDMQDFEEMNWAYIEMLGDHRPARTVIGVSELPKPGVLLTMNFTAVTKE